jgi:hypothetical protein
MAKLLVVHFASYGFMHDNMFWCEGGFTIKGLPTRVTNVERRMSFDSIFHRLSKCSNFLWDIGYYKLFITCKNFNEFKQCCKVHMHSFNNVNNPDNLEMD